MAARRWRTPIAVGLALLMGISAGELAVHAGMAGGWIWLASVFIGPVIVAPLSRRRQIAQGILVNLVMSADILWEYYRLGLYKTAGGAPWGYLIGCSVFAVSIGALIGVFAKRTFTASKA